MIRLFRIFFVILVTLLLFSPQSSVLASPESDFFEAMQAALTENSQPAAISTSLENESGRNLSDNNSNQKTVALTRPGIVRIVTRIKGTSTVDYFDIDFKTLSWVVRADKAGKTIQTPYDTYQTGTGFIVSQDGYILTNTHVVSDQSLKTDTASRVIGRFITLRLALMTPQETADLERTTAGQTAEQIQARGKKLAIDGIQFLKDHMRFNEKPTVAIVKPSAPGAQTATTSQYTNTIARALQDDTRAQMQAIMQNGVKATVIYENESFQDDEKDFALLKIPEQDLPAIRIGNSDTVRSGDRISVYGFPSNADYAGLNSEPSFTTGNVNALKESVHRTFNYIQTDAAISHGSSGGPLFDQNGNVVGIITKQKNENDAGNSFGFAIPINLVRDILNDTVVATSTSGDYADTFSAGLLLLEQRHCKAANDKFASAKNTNTIFGGTEKYVQPYIDHCAELIATGASIDTKFDEFKDFLFSIKSETWIIAGISALTIIALLGTIVFLRKRVRRDEQFINQVENQIVAERWKNEVATEKSQKPPTAQ